MFYDKNIHNVHVHKLQQKHNHPDFIGQTYQESRVVRSTGDYSRNALMQQSKLGHVLRRNTIHKLLYFNRYVIYSKSLF